MSQRPWRRDVPSSSTTRTRGRRGLGQHRQRLAVKPTRILRVWRCIRDNLSSRAVVAVAVLGCVLSGYRVVGEPSATPLIFAGSGTNLPITRLLGEAFERLYPQRKIEVPPSIGSTGGIQAVADGAVALGLISRSLKPPEKALGLTSIPYARTAVVIGVHPSVSDDGITFAQLVDIYRGTRTHWQDGRDIIVLTREPGDSSIEILEQVIAGFKEVFAESQQAKRWTTLHRDQEMNQTLTSKPYAIGLSDMGAIPLSNCPSRS